MQRRSPLQARSRARVDQILDAADRVFLEMGYAEATTNHVAAAAGTSIGSLYRFFPNKEALLVALAERYGERMLDLAKELTPPGGPARPLAESVGEGIDRFNTFMAENPGFRTLVAEATRPCLREVMARGGEQMVAVLAAGQGGRLAEADPREAFVVAAVTNTVLSALHLLSFQGDEGFRRAVVAEMKRLVVPWLEVRVGERAPG